MRTLVRAVGSVLLSLAWAASVGAQAPLPDLGSLRIQGWGPDAQLVGGAGFGLGGSLQNPFLGRLRLGALYAREPWVWNAGVEAQVGGLREWGFGGEVEVNHFKGMYAALGVGTAQLEDPAMHVSVGYTIVALEWQHRFAPREPRDALMIVVRAPLGLWWFLTRRSDTVDDDRSKARGASAASGQRAHAAAPASEPDAAAIAAADAAQLERQVEVERALAAQYEASGELASAELALTRAYAYEPRPELLLDLARVEQAQGKLARAAADLERLLAVPAEQRSAAHTDQAEAQLAQLLPRLGTLRLSLLNARGDERVEIDAEPFAGGLLGYDLRVDPGPHLLSVLRGGRALLTRRFEVEPGSLLRLEVDLDAPSPGEALAPSAGGSPAAPPTGEPAPADAEGGAPAGAP